MRLSIVLLLLTVGATYGYKEDTVVSECSTNPDGTATAAAAPDTTGLTSDDEPDDEAKQQSALMIAETMFNYTQTAAKFASSSPWVAKQALRALSKLVTGVKNSAHALQTGKEPGSKTERICATVMSLADDANESLTALLADEKALTALFDKVETMDFAAAKKAMKAKLEEVKQQADVAATQVAHQQLDKVDDMYIGILIQVGDMAGSMGLGEWIMGRLSPQTSSVVGWAWNKLGNVLSSYEADHAADEEAARKAEEDIINDQQIAEEAKITTPFSKGKFSANSKAKLQALAQFIKLGNVKKH